MTKKIFLLLVLSLCWLGGCEAKMCWEECRAGAGLVETADIQGCRRRSTFSTFPASQDFRCQGSLGPPCTVFRGDTVHLDVNWVNPGVRDMTQSTHWVSWVELPWVGMETEACPYLDTGAGCGNNTVDILTNIASHCDTVTLSDQDQQLQLPHLYRDTLPSRSDLIRQTESLELCDKLVRRTPRTRSQ